MDPRTQNQQKRETHADDFQPRTSSSPQNIIFFKKRGSKQPINIDFHSRIQRTQNETDNKADMPDINHSSPQAN